MYIYNANVITMAEKNYENGFILIENDKIKAVGDMSQLKDFSPSDSDIDAKGRTAYPGFIDAHTHIGAWEDGLAFEGDDGNEDTDPSTPNLRAIDMINPLDHCFEEAAQAGVTSVVCGMGKSHRRNFSCYENGRLKEDRQEDNKKSRCGKICTRRKSQERI